jgi:hypothetical protein
MSRSVNTNTIHRGRFLLIAAITLLVAFAATAAAAKAITSEQGASPASGPQYVTYTMSAPQVSKATGVAHCPEGTKPIDGGVSSNDGFTRVVSSAVDSEGSGWSVSLWNQHPSRTLTAHVWAECLAVG